MIHRREFLRNGLRGGALALLGGAASMLAWRSSRGNCARTHPCGACPLFSGCVLPKAVDAKQPTRKPGHV